MTYETRILSVLETDRLTKQGDLVKAARMAPQTAADVLAALVAEGRVERFLAHTGQRGKPAHLYRLRRVG